MSHCPETLGEFHGCLSEAFQKASGAWRGCEQPPHASKGLQETLERCFQFSQMKYLPKASGRPSGPRGCLQSS